MHPTRLFGSILLIIGTTIGGGMFALPVVTAAGGFWPATGLLVGIWAIMMLGALLTLEVNLWFPPESNLFSMARATLGPVGAIITILSYMLLLYCLLAAYMAGGADLSFQLSHYLNMPLSRAMGTALFVLLFAGIVWHGIGWVDRVNRGLMSVKMLVYCLLVGTLLSQVHSFVPIGNIAALPGASLVVATSFGYAIIVPSLRTYLHSDAKALRLAIIIGSAIPLFCYIAWNYVVQGSLGTESLVALNKSNSDVVSALMQGLAKDSHFHLFIHGFTVVCVLTAFLSVSLALTDFIADSLQLRKQGFDKAGIYLLTFLPPLLMVYLWPYIFIKGLHYAGIFCVIILLLLPAAMAASGRYTQGRKGYRVVGGPLLLGGVFLGGCAVLAMHALSF